MIPVESRINQTQKIVALDISLPIRSFQLNLYQYIIYINIPIIYLYIIYIWHRYNRYNILFPCSSHTFQRFIFSHVHGLQVLGRRDASTASSHGSIGMVLKSLDPHGKVETCWNMLKLRDDGMTPLESAVFFIGHLCFSLHELVFCPPWPSQGWFWPFLVRRRTGLWKLEFSSGLRWNPSKSSWRHG